MEKTKIILNILKENAVYVLPIFLVIILFFVFVTPKFPSTINAVKILKQNETSYKDQKKQYDSLKFQQDNQNRTKKVVKDGKVIFDAPGMQFSPDASFAPLFELVLTIAQQSGIRIRAIDYNYAPEEDMIFSARIEGYNACELNMIAVGTYSEFQVFFKTVMKEQYLTSLVELELTPWEKDKKILIAKIKLRLYTRTMADNQDIAEQPGPSLP